MLPLEGAVRGAPGGGTVAFNAFGSNFDTTLAADPDISVGSLTGLAVIDNAGLRSK